MVGDLNTYAYVYGNPIRNIDLLGLFSCNQNGSVNPVGISNSVGEGAGAWAQYQYEQNNTDFTYVSDAISDCGGAQRWKCNCFVKHALKEGGGVSYEDLPKHYHNGNKGEYFAQANDLANTTLNTDVLGMGNGKVGNIVAWGASIGSGHTGIIGCDGKIYSAVRDGIARWNKVTLFSAQQMMRYFGRREKIYRTCCNSE